MREYIGKYRIDIERDYYTDDPIREGQTWIRVDSTMRNRGGKVYRYDTDTLVAYIPSVQRANNVVKYMKSSAILVKELIEYTDGYDIYFSENDLQKMGTVLKLSTYGASTPPESIKNHKHKDKIREEKRNERTEEENERFRLLGEKLRQSKSNN